MVLLPSEGKEIRWYLPSVQTCLSWSAVDSLSAFLLSGTSAFLPPAVSLTRLSHCTQDHLLESGAMDVPGLLKSLLDIRVWESLVCEMTCSSFCFSEHLKCCHCPKHILLSSLRDGFCQSRAQCCSSQRRHGSTHQKFGPKADLVIPFGFVNNSSQEIILKAWGWRYFWGKIVT